MNRREFLRRLGMGMGSAAALMAMEPLKILAQDEKKQIIADARKSADSQYNKIVEDAKQDAREIKDAAVAEANQEKNKIIASAKKEIADIVVDATTKVVGSKTGADVDSELFDEFLVKAGE